MQIYMVGGAVRDMLLGRTPHDRDFVVFGSTIAEMLAAGFKQVGQHFPVFIHPQTREEYALARKEIKTGPKHNDFKFIFSPDITPAEDVQRRDFTCNALLYDMENQHIIDLVGGRQDIQAGRLRHVNSEHFIEDPLRVLRMCRFAAKLSFTIDSQTMKLAHGMVAAGMLAHLTAERIWQEIFYALHETNFADFITYMQECDALASILPEVATLWPQPSVTNNQTWGEVILSALRHSENLSPKAKFALLLHHLDTPQIKQLCKRLKAPHDYSQFAICLAENYMKLLQVENMSSAELITLLQNVCGLKNGQLLAQYIMACRIINRFSNNTIKKDRSGCFRRSALRLIRNLKIQRTIKATAMPKFSQLSKDQTFSTELFNFRCHHVE